MDITLSDVAMFLRCTASTLPSCVRSFGWYHGPRLAIWCGVGGVQLKHEDEQTLHYHQVKAIVDATAHGSAPFRTETAHDSGR